MKYPKSLEKQKSTSISTPLRLIVSDVRDAPSRNLEAKGMFSLIRKHHDLGLETKSERLNLSNASNSENNMVGTGFSFTDLLLDSTEDANRLTFL